MAHRRFHHVLLPVLALGTLQCSKESQPPMTPASATSSAPASATDDNSHPPANSSVSGASGSATRSDARSLTDPQIAAISRAANQAEVDQAKAAVGRAKLDAVKKFAEMMIAHHGQALKQQTELETKLGLQPAESTTVTELRVEATSTLSKLEGTTTGFDRVYIQSQVDAHQKVLSTIDGQLLPNVQSPELKKMLEELRPQIVSHLAKAEEILKTLQ